MSAINPQYASPFAAPNALTELEPFGGPGTNSAAVSPQSSDAIFKGNPIALPSPPTFDGGAEATPPAYGGSSVASILNELGTIMNALLAQLQKALGSYASTQPQPQPITTPIATPEQNFTSATASSTGDPHLAFDGRAASGATVDGKWDSMTSHGNLLSSDSFGGGYRVSTVATAPDAHGVAYNQSATVATEHGEASVTLKNDGSYAVTEHGHDVELVTGQATSIGHNETVERNADGSLTIADRNAQGGSITTTLTSNGKGVDVNTKATNVNLGGFIVDKSDNDYDPVAGGASYAPLPGASYGATGLPYTPGSWTQPESLQLPSPEIGLEQFDPDLENASYANIAEA